MQIQDNIQYKHAQSHTQVDAGPSGKRQCSTALYFGLLGLLGDVSMVTVMSDLQTCTLPSIWLRLANQITSTHTQMHCQILSRMRKFFGGVILRSLLHHHSHLEFVLRRCHFWDFCPACAQLMCLIFGLLLALFSFVH